MMTKDLKKKELESAQKNGVLPAKLVHTLESLSTDRHQKLLVDQSGPDNYPGNYAQDGHLLRSL